MSLLSLTYRWIPGLIPLLVVLAGNAEAADLANPGQSHQSTSKTAPTDAFIRLRHIEENLERIRSHMGAPQSNQMNINIHNAAPHDLYFGARTLFQKSNQLLFEITRQEENIPPIPKRVLRPEDVLELTLGVDQILHLVLADLGIAHNTPSNTDNTVEKTPSEIFQAIQMSNRQLNLLLEQRLKPSNVHMQVTLAIGYLARQLAAYPGTTQIPDPHPLQPGRIPADVYHRLLESTGILARIFRTVGLKSLVIDAGALVDSSITPSDVYDIAALIVARLDFLHHHMKITKTPLNAFYPGRKYPSDVYQQASILIQQLHQLEQLIASAGNTEPGS